MLLSLPILIGALIDVSAGQASLFGVAGPACVVGEWIGPAGCPGCGLTRASALTVQGQFSQAWGFHAAGLILIPLCVAGIAIHLHILFAGRGRTQVHDRLLSWGTRALLASVLVAWLVRF